MNSSKTTPCQRKVLTKILKYTEVYRNQLQKSYDRTSEVLRTFKENDPELFEQVNNIRDKDGNVTDVYIKVINDYGAENGIYGSTNLNQSAHDIDAYTSPYGDYSVLVKVAECPKVLSLLAHEFGHVIYQVPNLASYVMYYQQAYGASGNSITGRGHLPDDPSHLSVKRVLKSFHRKSRKGP